MQGQGQGLISLALFNVEPTWQNIQRYV